MAVAHPFRSFLSHFWQQARGRYLTVFIADIADIACAMWVQCSAVICCSVVDEVLTPGCYRIVRNNDSH
jgi:hypothetical protein